MHQLSPQYLQGGHGEGLAPEVASASAAQAIVADGRTHVLNLDTAVCTISLAAPAAAPAGVLLFAYVEYVQDATGGRAINDPAGIQDDANNPVVISTTPDKSTLVLYWSRDGGATWRQALIWTQA